MLSIAICDDDREMCYLLHKMLCGFVDIPIHYIDVFYTGESLCDAVQSGKHYDLFILDIELRSTTGVQVGIFLRDELKQIQAQMLFISGKDSYMKQLFDLRPLNFLLKPIVPVKMHECLLCALDLFEQSSPCFEYYYRKILYRIPYRGIIYFESQNKTLLIHTVTSTSEATMQLSAVMMKEPAPPKQFFQIHQSYFVNFQYVRRSSYSEIVMENGVVLPVSYVYRKEVRERLHALSFAGKER